MGRKPRTDLYTIVWYNLTEYKKRDIRALITTEIPNLILKGSLDDMLVYHLTSSGWIEIRGYTREKYEGAIQPLYTPYRCDADTIQQCVDSAGEHSFFREFWKSVGCE